MPSHPLQLKEAESLNPKDTKTRCYPVKNPVLEKTQQRERVVKER